MAGRAAILLSRQPLRPCGGTPWVANTVAAVRWLKEKNIQVCSSVGMQTWELITAIASLEAVPIRCYLQRTAQGAESTESEITHDFGLSPDLVEFAYVDQAGLGGTEPTMPARDRMVVDTSDILIPISVRRSGFMAELLDKGFGQGKEVIRAFQLSERDRPRGIAYNVNPARLNPAIDELTGKYLIHWTRATNDRWPDERSIDYYSAIIHSTSYPRTGLDTLSHIFDTKRIMGSSRHMPNKIATVAFSSLAPREVVPLMRYRARYSEMSFEPYGVGVSRELAVSLKIQPVIYYADRKPPIKSADKPWLFQSMGSKSDWRQEQEYRHAGDLSLDPIPWDAFHVFCRFPHEAELLQRQYGIPVTSIEI